MVCRTVARTGSGAGGGAGAAAVGSAGWGSLCRKPKTPVTLPNSDRCASAEGGAGGSATRPRGAIGSGEANSPLLDGARAVRGGGACSVATGGATIGSATSGIIGSSCGGMTSSAESSGVIDVGANCSELVVRICGTGEVVIAGPGVMNIGAAYPPSRPSGGSGM